MWGLRVFEEKLIFGLNTKCVHLITGKVCSTRKKIQHLLKEIFIHLQQNDIIAK